MEMFRKTLDYVEAGDNAGVLLRGVDRKAIERGQVYQTGGIKPHTKFTAEIYVLSKEEAPHAFLQQLPSSVLLPTTDVTGSLQLPGGVEMVMPGDNVTISSEWIAPIAMVVGLRFAIREGGLPVGAGVVAKIEK